MPRSSRAVTFATSNVHKVREVQGILAEFGIGLKRVNSKGTEIQADDLTAISAFAARAASRLHRRPVLVEDAGLFIDELGGFPGPYSSYVYRKVGLDEFIRMLRVLSSRSATFRSSVSYCVPDGEPISFEGRTTGSISLAPSGRGGFGFDPVFRPRGRDLTLAEMTIEEKGKISHRGKAMRKFARWFLTNE